MVGRRTAAEHQNAKGQSRLRYGHIFHWLIAREIKTNGKILQEKRPRVDARPYFGTEIF
jgi:hypothetical protein